MIVRSHRSFFHRLEWTWRAHPFEAGEVGCQKAHMTTTHLVYELFEPMLRGTPVLIIPDADVRRLDRFWAQIAEGGVSRLLLVPSMLQASLAMPEWEPPVLKVLVLMGEHLPAKVAREIAARAPEATAIYSIYGSTEASSTIVCDVRASIRDGEELPLGEPISSEIEVQILDEQLCAVPEGEVGRLHVSGPSLFEGYLNDPDRTSDALVRVGAKTLYDTRDDVRLGHDGRLFFVGRTDQTVKIRGFRVDLPEIETALLAHPGVEQAAAVSCSSPHELIVGYIAPDDIVTREALATVRSLLPAYMVPSRLTALPKLPLTPNGKIDRLALARICGELDEGGAFVAGTNMEQLIASAWERTLGHRQFEADTSFFEAGGTSLSVFRLVIHLRETLDLEDDDLDEGTVYRFPTVGELAEWLNGDRAAMADASAAEEERVLVTLRRGSPEFAPLFIIASAGGTLGAYERLTPLLETSREIVGVRDPVLWGGRAHSDDFGSWVDRYESGILKRQPEGPYHILAYSSAGAFGYELASRLRTQGHEVALLALVDPLGLEFASRPGFGYWALRATWMGRLGRTLVRWVGALRRPARGLLSPPRAKVVGSMAPGESEASIREIRQNRGLLVNLSTLLELHSGLPFALSEEDFDGVEPEDRSRVLTSRVAAVAPEVDPAMIERMVVQYELQVRAQHRYRLARYEGPVLLVEPVSPYAGLLGSLLRPHVGRLRHRLLPLGPASPDTQRLLRRFGSLQGHYRCMRDGPFVTGLAQELNEWLG